MNRRRQEESEGGLPWSKILSGHGLDIGSGDDLLPGAIPFDKEDGDANNLAQYFPSRTFDFLHASHVLEHVFDPAECVRDWLSLLKPGGHLVGEVPSWELYEGKRPTSIWNPDHKTTWSMWSKKGGSVLPHIFAPDFFASFGNTEVVSLRLIDTNYNYLTGASVDQTYDFSHGVECYIEFVLRKT